MFSRFAHLLTNSGDAETVESVRDMIRSLERDDRRFAEIRGGVDTNLNLHPALCDNEIVFPGDRTDDIGRHSILADDLYLMHDICQNRLVLRSRSMGCEIVPIYHGFLVVSILPMVQQALLNLAPIFMGDTSLYTLSGVAEHETPCVLPRLSLGDLLLERKTWLFSVKDLPAAENHGSKEFDSFLSVNRWRMRHGMPERMFVRVRAGESSATEEPDDNVVKISRKPSYVDFASQMSMRQFVEALSLLAATQVLIMTEMLPSPNEVDARTAEDYYAREFVVEMSQQGRDLA